MPEAVELVQVGDYARYVIFVGVKLTVIFFDDRSSVS
jgi:hypothetical protein